MKLASSYTDGKFGLSFELYPPKDDDGMRDLFANLADLVKFGPSFITCTYGAGGSTRDRTLEIVTRVKQEHGLPVADRKSVV